jgi:hypothetical protein
MLSEVPQPVEFLHMAVGQMLTDMEDMIEEENKDSPSAEEIVAMRRAFLFLCMKTEHPKEETPQ